MSKTFGAEKVGTIASEVLQRVELGVCMGEEDQGASGHCEHIERQSGDGSPVDGRVPSTISRSFTACSDMIIFVIFSQQHLGASLTGRGVWSEVQAAKQHVRSQVATNELPVFQGGRRPVRRRKAAPASHGGMRVGMV